MTTSSYDGGGGKLSSSALPGVLPGAGIYGGCGNPGVGILDPGGSIYGGCENPGGGGAGGGPHGLQTRSKEKR